MASRILTACVVGLEAYSVTVEADVSPGLPSFTIVGLPDTSIQEAKERIKSAMKHADVSFPRTRVTVNLAPADLKKVGTLFDLPIAIAILMVQGDVPHEAVPTRLVAGELGLDGGLRPFHGVIAFASLAKFGHLAECIVPQANAKEAALISGVDVRSAQSLHGVINHLQGGESLPLESTRLVQTDKVLWNGPNFSAIRGQMQTRRALEIAAAGGHNILMQGPPGSGKTLLARTFPSILPSLSNEEMLEVTRIHSICGFLSSDQVMTQRPFRSPHHSASMVSLVGGGSHPRPGEISLAHRGVLFLDEFLEFPRALLESLRQPLEDGCVTVSRIHGTLTFPARFTLVAAMNPCECGFFTDDEQRCTCTPIQIQRYRRRLSGPFLDRMDLFLAVPKVKINELSTTEDTESSEVVRSRVQAARFRQNHRFSGAGIYVNAEMTSDQARKLICLSDEARSLLRQVTDHHRLSARAYFRTLKTAQTIADLASRSVVQDTDIAEAIQYRQSN